MVLKIKALGCGTQCTEDVMVCTVGVLGSIVRCTTGKKDIRR